jgi:hypothetical protein
MKWYSFKEKQPLIGEQIIIYNCQPLMCKSCIFSSSIEYLINSKLKWTYTNSVPHIKELFKKKGK